MRERVTPNKRQHKPNICGSNIGSTHKGETNQNAGAPYDLGVLTILSKADSLPLLRRIDTVIV